MQILDCGHENKDAPKPGQCGGTGYATLPDGRKICYDCAAQNEITFMCDRGRIALYDCDNNVQNWTGRLKYLVLRARTGRHNWGIRRYDKWFRGPDGAIWHGVRYGDDTQLIHCRRTKG